jgi:hypothetical protein
MLGLPSGTVGLSDTFERECTLLDGRRVKLILSRLDAAKVIVDEVLGKPVSGITAPGQ